MENRLSMEELISAVKSFSPQERQTFLGRMVSLEDVKKGLLVHLRDSEFKEAVLTPYRYTVMLEQNEAGGYTVTVPALAGCITEGDDIADALTNAKEAIECYLESLALHEESFPPDVKSVWVSLRDTEEVLLVKINVYPEVELA